ncbi:hypothetical protein PISMIDRAFT_671078 [Pisolithus microcarpus 441]|uniref:Uncharacterized protein n=1 Tax=Pisolithus microcarpus 441 TaxID=765257 RepID=A0A0C9YY72_9AGAM|nr:hypothetical protein PISMIDRAFT_671078 [Pisolithus microcarpus 441]
MGIYTALITRRREVQHIKYFSYTVKYGVPDPGGGQGNLHTPPKPVRPLFWNLRP